MHFPKPFAVLLFFCVGVCARLTPQSLHTAAFSSSNLPIVVIDTHGRTIPDEPKIPATMGVIYTSDSVRNTLTDPFNHYNGRIMIEVRGSSSQQFDKKQYGFSTVDSAGADLDVPLAGFPSEHSWILSAQFNDKSLVRDAVTFLSAREMGRYASRVKYCELVLNGDYKGIYILMEKIKRGKSRVNITKMGAADTSGDALTGGYIFKTDKADKASDQGWDATFPPFSNGTAKRFMYQYEYPDPEEMSAAQKQYLQSYVRSFETVMIGLDYADPVAGYPSVIDVGSFADMVILNELSRNVDGYRLSTFFYKDRDSKNKKLYAGPLWDYGLGYANCNYYSAFESSGWQIDVLTSDPAFLRSDAFQAPFWWKRLWADPAFKKAVARRWSALRTGVLSQSRVFAKIDSISSVITEARVRNFERWRIIGTWVWPNYYVSTSYEDEIAYMKGWMTKRFAWMDAALAPYVTGVAEEHDAIPSSFSLVQNFPNPFNPSTMIRFSVSAPQRVRLTVSDVLGREVAVLFEGVRQAGVHHVEWNAGSLPGGVYFCRMQADGSASVIRMALMK
ncbi:MAG: CotH kinase family protein [Acidobacteriota bacterium]